MIKSVEGNIDVLALKGRIDQPMTAELENSLQEYLDSKKYKLLVDMTDVFHICSSALGVLVATKRKFQKYDGDIKLVIVNDNLRQLFEITMLNKLFEIFDDRKMALNSFDY